MAASETSSRRLSVYHGSDQSVEIDLFDQLDGAEDLSDATGARVVFQDELGAEDFLLEIEPGDIDLGDGKISFDISSDQAALLPVGVCLCQALIEFGSKQIPTRVLYVDILENMIGNSMNSCVAEVLKTWVEEVASVAATETDLHAYSIPAGKLSANGQSLHYESILRFNSGSGVKRLRLYVAGQFILDTNPGLAVTLSAGAVVRASIYRTSAEAIATSVEINYFTSPGSPASYLYTSGIAFNPNQSNTFQLTGTCADDGAIIAQCGKLIKIK